MEEGGNLVSNTLYKNSKSKNNILLNNENSARKIQKGNTQSNTINMNDSANINDSLMFEGTTNSQLSNNQYKTQNTKSQVFSETNHQIQVVDPPTIKNKRQQNLHNESCNLNDTLVHEGSIGKGLKNCLYKTNTNLNNKQFSSVSNEVRSRPVNEFNINEYNHQKSDPNNEFGKNNEGNYLSPQNPYSKHKDQKKKYSSRSPQKPGAKIDSPKKKPVRETVFDEEDLSCMTERMGLGDNPELALLAEIKDTVHRDDDIRSKKSKSSMGSKHKQNLQKNSAGSKPVEKMSTKKGTDDNHSTNGSTNFNQVHNMYTGHPINNNNSKKMNDRKFDPLDKQNDNKILQDISKQHPSKSKHTKVGKVQDILDEEQQSPFDSVTPNFNMDKHLNEHNNNKNQNQFISKNANGVVGAKVHSGIYNKPPLPSSYQSNNQDDVKKDRLIEFHSNQDHETKYDLNNVSFGLEGLQFSSSNNDNGKNFDQILDQNLSKNSSKYLNHKASTEDKHIENFSKNQHDTKQSSGDINFTKYGNTTIYNTTNTNDDIQYSSKNSTNKKGVPSIKNFEMVFSNEKKTEDKKKKLYYMNDDDNEHSPYNGEYNRNESRQLNFQSNSQQDNSSFTSSKVGNYIEEAKHQLSDTLNDLENKNNELQKNSENLIFNKKKASNRNNMNKKMMSEEEYRKKRDELDDLFNSGFHNHYKNINSKQNHDTRDFCKQSKNSSRMKKSKNGQFDDVDSDDSNCYENDEDYRENDYNDNIDEDEDYDYYEESNNNLHSNSNRGDINSRQPKGKYKGSESGRRIRTEADDEYYVSGGNQRSCREKRGQNQISYRQKNIEMDDKKVKKWLECHDLQSEYLFLYKKQLQKSRSKKGCVSQNG